MRLVTLNAWAMRGDWAARRTVFQEGFCALDADIVTLRETIMVDGVDQAAEMLGPGFRSKIHAVPENRSRVRVASCGSTQDGIAEVCADFTTSGYPWSSVRIASRFWVGSVAGPLGIAQPHRRSL
jgi:hypothetical protein